MAFSHLSKFAFDPGLHTIFGNASSPLLVLQPMSTELTTNDAVVRGYANSTKCGTDLFILDPEGTSTLDMALRTKQPKAVLFGQLQFKMEGPRPAYDVRLYMDPAAVILRLKYDAPDVGAMMLFTRGKQSQNDGQEAANGIFSTPGSGNYTAISGYEMKPGFGTKTGARDAISYFNEGLELERAGRLNDALDAYRMVFTVDPTVKQREAHIKASSNMGALYLLDGNNTDAAYCYKHSIELDADQFDARHNYAVSLYGLNRETAALHQWSIVLEQTAMAKRATDGLDKNIEALPADVVKRSLMADKVAADASHILTQIVEQALESGKESIAALAYALLVKYDPSNTKLPEFGGKLTSTTAPQPREDKLTARKSLVELSKTVSHALRHAPWEYELELDAEGWVDVDLLVEAIASEPRWTGLNRNVFDRMIAEVNEDRLEIRDNMVRARYGHSLPDRIEKEPATPPDVLYHGTDMSMLDNIFREGLTPQKRQYVHLSTSREKATSVAKRKGKDTIILTIRTKPLLEKGVKFYPGNEHVWLVDALSSDMFEIDQ